MKIFRAVLLILSAILLVKVFVVSIGGLFMAVHFRVDLPENEKELFSLYTGMIIYGILSVFLSITTGYVLYRRVYKARQQSLAISVFTIAVTTSVFCAQMLSSSFPYSDLVALNEFMENTLWMPGFLVLSNALLFIVNLLDKRANLQLA